MRKILVYLQTINPRELQELLDDCELLTVSTKLALVESLIEEIDLFWLLIQLERVDDEWHSFLDSVKKSFPILDSGIVALPGAGAIPDGYDFIDGNLNNNQISEEIQKRLSHISAGNRRMHHRFDWPLRGYLSADTEEHSEYRVRSISAGGAYLETRVYPERGSTGNLRIEFQNFSLHTPCEILGPRQASSNLPPGFGVRFVGLSPDVEQRIDKIVNDALIHTLLEPEAETPVPFIGGDESLPDAFTIM